MADLVLAFLAALPFAATAILPAPAALGTLGRWLVTGFTTGVEGLLALGPLESFLFQADMVADEPVQLLLLAGGFLLSIQQHIDAAGNGILY
ncbi:hypothetical protein D3C80_825620 [compost metagenome]